MQDSDRQPENDGPDETEGAPDIEHSEHDGQPSATSDVESVDSAELEPADERTPLERLRHDVAARLQKIVDSDRDVRRQVDELNTRLQPLLKSFQKLEPVLSMEHPDIVRVLAESVNATEARVQEIRELQNLMVREVRFREQISEAALENWQNHRQLTAGPADLWHEKLAKLRQSHKNRGDEFRSNVESLERRWISNERPSNEPDSVSPESGEE